MSANVELIESEGRGSYISQRRREKYEIIQALKNGLEIEYYNNFIMINNKTYNGWTEKLIEDLKLSLISNDEEKQE